LDELHVESLIPIFSFGITVLGGSTEIFDRTFLLKVHVLLKI